MAGTKRKHSQDSSNEMYNNKMRCRPTAEPRVDPTYGQRSAIPGLDEDLSLDGAEDGLSYDDDMDALSYLRAVRQEAIAIPNLLVAPKESRRGKNEIDHSIYEDGVGDYRGSYEDGAYYATRQKDQEMSDTGNSTGETVGKDAQLVYFDSIISRYEALRAQLGQTPPVEVVAKLDGDHPTYLGKLNTKISRWWKWKMRTVDPLPAQLASMDKGTVLRLLGLLTTGSLLKRGADVEIFVSRWSWGLLARLPDRGELTSEEIGVVRELGKKAVLVGTGLKEKKEWEEGMDEVEAGFNDDGEGEEAAIESEHEEVEALHDEIDSEDYEEEQTPSEPLPTPPEDIAAAKSRILARLNNPDPEEEPAQEAEPSKAEENHADVDLPRRNTKATVDMIITVVGEMYGQRDLLEFREVWGE